MFFSDDLGNDLQVGSLNDTTEIVVKPNIITSTNESHNNNISVDENLSNSVKIDSINHNDIIPIKSFLNNFVYRTILVNETLLESAHIYDYCALISKSHMSIMYKNVSSYSNGINFVKLSLIHELVDSKDSKQKPKTNDRFVVLRLCPLDPFMNNIEKMKVITWPTIYITKTLSKLFGLKTNSKVMLEPVYEIDNAICNIKCIYISPLKEMVCYIFYCITSIINSLFN